MRCSRNIPRLVRFYSPVRSRISVLPPRLVPRPNLANKTTNIVNHGSGDRIAVPPALQDMLSEPMLVVERQLEIMNVFLGYEQANRYTIYNPQGGVLGYMEEADMSFSRAIARQFTRLHRPFTVHVYDTTGNHAMTIRRPFSWINSHIYAVLPGRDYTDNSAVIGESKQEWHLWRRRYNLYLNNVDNNEMDQFGRVDAPFLSFQFPVKNEQEQLVGAVDRNWVGLAREWFTDTGVYVVRMDDAQLQDLGVPVAPYQLNLEQRAVMLALMVSIDFDYFSRHSNNNTGFVGVGDSFLGGNDQ